MKSLIVIFSMTLFSTITFANSTTELIETNVDHSFKQSALSLLSKADIKKVELIDNRVVVSLNTSNKYFEVKVANGPDSFTKKKSLGTVKVPFPKTGDLEECFGGQVCPSQDYLQALRGYGISQTASETMNEGRMALYFKTIEYRSLFKADQNIHIGFVLNSSQSSFDSSNPAPFFVNGCDGGGCWGAFGIKLDFKQK